MSHIRDVWVNWFEGEENGYNVCDFFEWRSDDRIEVLDQAVIVRVTHRLYDFIQNQMSDLPDQLLRDVYKQSFLRKNMSRIQLDYGFIASDGQGIIAVDTMGYKTPIRKSRLTPRQEQLVYEMLANDEGRCYDIEEKQTTKEYHILSPSPKEMNGLTRKERQLKQLLYMALDQLYTSGNKAEIRYWYTEWAADQYNHIQEMTRDEAWEALFSEVRAGWSDKHYQLCESMIRGQAFFEKLWELEHGESVK